MPNTPPSSRASYDLPDVKAKHREIERGNEAEKAKEQLRKAHGAMIDQVPYGALGVIHEADASSPATWIYSDDVPVDGSMPLAQFAREFLGFDETSQVSITNSEKRILHQLSERELSSITPETVRQDRKDSAELEQAASDLWAPALMTYPHLAQFPNEARQALERLVTGSGLSKRDLARLARDPATQSSVIDKIVQELEYPSSISNIRPAYRDEDDDRAVGFGTGANGGGRSRTEQDEQRESIMAGISEWQQKTGFTRS